MKKLLCKFGFHKFDKTIKFVPRNMNGPVSIKKWFRDENFDWKCSRCPKIRHGV